MLLGDRLGRHAVGMSSEWISSGRRVVVTQRPLRGSHGTVVRSFVVFKRTLWLVKIDGGVLGVGVVPFSSGALIDEAKTHSAHPIGPTLHPGQRVKIRTYPFQGSYGTLIRPAWWFGLRAWLVQIEGRGVGRTLIVERWLEPGGDNVVSDDDQQL